MKTIAVCLAALLCGCSITGHLERRQYCADVLHVSREQREREQQTYQPPALKIEWDSNRFYLVPTEVQENGERIMAMQMANDNAKKLLDSLQLEYNKLRQQNITAELLDILGGSVQ